MSLIDTGWKNGLHLQLLEIVDKYEHRTDPALEAEMRAFMRTNYTEDETEWAVSRVLGRKSALSLNVGELRPSVIPSSKGMRSVRSRSARTVQTVSEDTPARTQVTFRMWEGLVMWLRRARDLDIKPAAFKLIWTTLDKAEKSTAGSYKITCERVQARDLLGAFEQLKELVAQRKLEAASLTSVERSTGMTHLCEITKRIRAVL